MRKEQVTGLSKALAMTTFAIFIICGAWLALVAADNGVFAEETHLLQPITAQDFLKLPEDLETMYVAGLMEGIAYTMYGYSIPDYPKYAECVRQKTLGETTADVVTFIRQDPEFKEGVSSAFAQMLGRRCKHK